MTNEQNDFLNLRTSFAVLRNRAFYNNKLKNSKKFFDIFECVVGIIDHIDDQLADWSNETFKLIVGYRNACDKLTVALDQMEAISDEEELLKYQFSPEVTLILRYFAKP